MGAEEEAKAHPSLDVREDGEVDEPFTALEVVDVDEPQDEGGVVEVVKKILPRRRSRKQVEEEE